MANPIPFDKFQPISIKEFIDAAAVEAQHSESLAAIRPQLTELIDARDAVVLEIGTVETQIAGLQASQDQLYQEIESLKAESTELAQSGGNPLKLNKKKRQAEEEVADIITWIEDLKAHLEGLYAKGNTAEVELFDSWMVAQESYTAAAQTSLNERLWEVSVYLIAYARGMQRTYKAILRPGEFPGKFGLTHAQLQGRKAFAGLQLRSRASILGIQERYAHQILGGLA